MNIFGAAQAPPGGTGGLLLDLKPGRYFIVRPVAVGNKPNSMDLQFPRHGGDLRSQLIPLRLGPGRMTPIVARSGPPSFRPDEDHDEQPSEIRS